MSQIPQTTLTRQAVAFWRLNEARFVRLYIDLLQNLRGNFFSTLPTDERQEFAVTNISGIIARFEGQQISLERTQQNLFGYFERGATLNDFSELLDSAIQSLCTEVERLLVAQPELGQTILQKLAYIRQAYGSTVALAMHTYKSLQP